METANPPTAVVIQSRMGSIFRQSSVLLASNLILIAFGYFFKIYLARTVGAEGLGLFALGDSLAAFFLLAITWQFDQAIFRFLPQFIAHNEPDRARRVIWASLFHVLLLGILAALFLILTRTFWADYVFHAEALAGALVFFALMLPLRGIEAVARLFARSYKEVVRVVTITTLIAFPIKVVVSIFLITLGFGFYGWLTGETVAIFVSAALLVVLGLHLSARALRRPMLTVRQERPVYSFSATMFGRSLLGIANVRLGTLLLGIFLTTADVGVYGICLTTVTLLDTLQSALNGAFAPHITELQATGKHTELARMYYRVTRWDLMGVLPIAVILIVLAEPMLSVFGPAFVVGASALSILALGELVNVGSGPVSTLLTMGGNERSVFWVLIVQLAVNSVLLILLMPRFGLVGAALAYSISTMVIYSTLYLYAKRKFPIHLFDRQMIQLLLAAVVLGVIAFGLRLLLTPYLPPVVLLFLVSAILAAIWAGMIWFALLDADDRVYFAETLRGVRTRLTLAR